MSEENAARDQYMRWESQRTTQEETQNPLLGDKQNGVETERQDEKAPGKEVCQVFCQMDVLYHFADGDMEWREAARWIKFEEKVEVGSRWSKPYVGTVSLHALFELRSCLANGMVSLNVPKSDVMTISGQIAADLATTYQLTADQQQKLSYVLTRAHKHQHRKGLGKEPFYGKLVELKEKDTVEEYNEANGNEKEPINPPTNPQMDSISLFPFPRLPDDGTIPIEAKKKYKPNKKFKRKVPRGSEVCNILVGEVDFLTQPVMSFVRLEESTDLQDFTEVPFPTRFIFTLLGPPEHHSIWEYEEVGRAVGNIMIDQVFHDVAFLAENRAELLSGLDEYIDDLTVLPPSVWDPATRLDPKNTKDATQQGDSAEYKKHMEANLRMRRKKAARETHLNLPHVFDTKSLMEEDEEGEDKTLMRTGRLFGGMWEDMKRRYPQYWSDIRDGVSMQGLASVVFLYFACLTPIVTFGGLLGDATDGMMGTMETILSGALCGLIYHTFSAQPLTIVGATGPLLVFESILYQLCKSYQWDFLSFRFYIGIWIFAILMLMVAFDLSALVRYITRFTEESFAVLISIIFIYEAISKQYKVVKKYPIKLHTEEHYFDSCNCMPGPCNDPNNTACIGTNLTAWLSGLGLRDDCCNYKGELVVDHDCLTESKCMAYGGNLTGTACYNPKLTHAVPDVFLFSIYLFLGTFLIALILNTFRNSSFFPTIVRTIVADFAVAISICICTGLDIALGLETPKLEVPSEFKTTVDGRGWIVNPGNISHWWLILLAAVPGVLATILIFLDQQITCVIVNRKEHKLKKSHGYHLDLFVLAILIALCSLLGLPWFVAATVRTITHVRSLMVQTESAAPGEKPTFLGVREQRLTGICIHVLIGVSVFLTFILKHIPKPVLFGVFMYMGVASLRGVQFIQRIMILFMPNKYQPDYIYLRHVRTLRVHLFTIIQILCMAAMWAVKAQKTISILFPILILALCVVRKLMAYYFTPEELEWLDDLSPDEARRHKEDQLKKHGGEHLTDYDMDKLELQSPEKVQSNIDLEEKNIVTKQLPETYSWKELTKTCSNNSFSDKSRTQTPEINRLNKNEPVTFTIEPDNTTKM